MYGIKTDKNFVSSRVFYTSGSGALYSPHSLHKDVFNEKLFQKLAPTEDDIWYWAMALRNNKSICVVANNLGIFNLNEYASQEDSLYSINSQNNTTEAIFHKMFLKFPDLKNKVIKSTPLIISLTSYPARIKTLHLTVKSLLAQTIKADKIILWLAKEQFPQKEAELPKELLDLTEQGLEIEWCHDIKSYKKLIPALKKYPDAIIVTADDDLLYNNDWLEKLLYSYMKNPHAIHCHRAHLISFENNNILPYRIWTQNIINSKTLYNTFPTSGAGVLYPPHCLSCDVADEEKFMRLCPQADDIWFWAMAVKNNTPIKVAESNISRLNYVDGTQKQALWRTNVFEGKNDVQLRNVLNEYPELENKLDKRVILKSIKIINEPKQASRKFILSYKLFNFIPLFSYKQRGGKQVWKLFGLPVWKIRRFENNIATKYYLLGLPLVKIINR